MCLNWRSSGALAQWRSPPGPRITNDLSLSNDLYLSLSLSYSIILYSQVTLVINDPTANAGDPRLTGSVPGVQFQYSYLENFTDRGATELQRVRHDWATMHAPTQVVENRNNANNPCMWKCKRIMFSWMQLILSYEQFTFTCKFHFRVPYCECS